MKPLVDVAAVVIKQAETLGQLNSQKHLRDRVIEVSSTINGLANDLAQAATFAVDCEQGGVTQHRILSDTAEQAVPYVQGLAELSMTDPIAVMEHADLPRVRTDAHQATQELKVAGREAWREYCDRHIPVPQAGLIELVETRDDGPTVATAKLEQLDANLAHLRSVDPTAKPGYVAVLLKNLGERAELWASLDLDHVPPAVREFLDLCAKNGVPLSQLTKEVTEWLGSEGLLDRYVVVPGDGT